MTRSDAAPAYDVVVVGAGVIGVAASYALANSGASVCLVDRAEGPGRGASFANGAQLSYAYADALAAPGLLRKLPALALGFSPLFRLQPGFDPGFYAWLAAFLRNMTGARFSANTREILALALESQREMQALLERHSIDFDHATPGKMHLHYSAEDLRATRDIVALKQQAGVRQDILSARAAIAIEPALEQVEDLAGVVHSPNDSVGDPLRFCSALSALCRQEFGAHNRFGFEVDRLQRASGLWRLSSREGRTLIARRVVLCAGLQSRAIAKALGLDVPIQPMKGYSLTAPAGPEPPRVSLTDTRRKIVFCRLGDRVRVAGLAELGANAAAADPARARLLRSLAREAMPWAADYAAIESEWAGLRPMTPSSRPIIRWVDPTLALNTGHGMLGWTLAMGSAWRLARAMPALGESKHFFSEEKKQKTFMNAVADSPERTATA